MHKQTLSRLIEIQSDLEQISKENVKKTEKELILEAVKSIEQVIRNEPNSLKYVDAIFEPIEKGYNTLESILKEYDLDIEMQKNFKSA